MSKVFASSPNHQTRAKVAAVTLRLSLVLSMFFAAALLASISAANDEPIRWLTGSEFRKELDTQVGVEWAGNPLRDALRNLSRQQRVAIFVDRRVDPDQKIDFSADKVPLDELLSQLAQRLKLGVCQIGSLVYIGPVDAASKLATVAAMRRSEIAALPLEAKRSLVTAQPWKWDDLAEPRILLSQLFEKANVRATDAEIQKIPHDLWPKADLPTLPWADRLTLLLAGFDLTFQVSKDGTAVRFGRIPDNVTYVQSYPAGNAAKLAADLRGKFPDTEIREEGGKVHVAGKFEDHQMIERLLRGEPVRKAQTTELKEVFTLNVERQQFGAIAKALASRLMLQLEAAPGVEEQLKENVTFSVKDATLKELLDALAKEGKVRYKLEGQTLKILPP